MVRGRGTRCRHAGGTGISPVRSTPLRLITGTTSGLLISIPLLVTAANTGWSRLGVAFVVLGLGSLLAALILRWATGVTLVVGFVALLAIGTLLDNGSRSYFPAALIGTALLIAAEFASWSLEIPTGRVETGPFVIRRLIAIGRLGLFAALLAVFAALLAHIALDGSTLLTAIGVGGAITILALAIWWIRRQRF